MDYIDPVFAFGTLGNLRDDELIVEGEKLSSSTTSDLPSAADNNTQIAGVVRRNLQFPAWILGLGLLVFILALSSERRA